MGFLRWRKGGFHYECEGGACFMDYLLFYMLNCFGNRLCLRISCHSLKIAFLIISNTELFPSVPLRSRIYCLALFDIQFKSIWPNHYSLRICFELKINYSPMLHVNLNEWCILCVSTFPDSWVVEAFVRGGGHSLMNQNHWQMIKKNYFWGSVLTSLPPQSPLL